MPKYLIWGHTLETDIDFPELIPARETDNPDITIKCDPSATDVQGDTYNTWYNAEGRPSVLFSHVGADYFVRAFDSATFLLNFNSQRIRYAPVPAVELHNLRHQILNLALPLLFSALGNLVLHGSAVSKDDSAIGFLGKGGAGKSTLAALFVHEFGLALIADDSLLLEVAPTEIQVRSSYCGLGLGGPSEEYFSERASTPVSGKASGKLMTQKIRFESRTLRVAAFYFLDESAECLKPRIETMTGREAYLNLLKFSYIIDPFHPKLLAGQFEALSTAGPLCKCFRLLYPRLFEKLPEVGSLIRDSTNW